MRTEVEDKLDGVPRLARRRRDLSWRRETFAVTWSGVTGTLAAPPNPSRLRRIQTDALPL